MFATEVPLCAADTASRRVRPFVCSGAVPSAGPAWLGERTLSVLGPHKSSTYQHQNKAVTHLIYARLRMHRHERA